MYMVDSLLKKMDKLDEATSYAPPVKTTLMQVERFCKEESGTPNNWYIGNRVFFFEWPIYGETEDGSVDGMVYEKIGSTSKRIGAYTISGDGKIIQFPFLPKDVISEVNANE